MNATASDTQASILVVDDTPSHLRLLWYVLSEQGYRVRVVADGQRALESVRADPPDLILLDILMPGMGGYEVCRQLKAQPATCDIPIIFLSALDTTTDKVDAFAAGGVDYVAKSDQPEEMLVRVKTHLALRDLRRRLEAANRELERQVTELQMRNAELDAFAHTVAHDLRNPLSIIVGYSQMLVEGATLMPPEDLRDYASNVLHSANKIGDTIESLLLLSGVRRQDVEIGRLDMGRIVAEARQRLLPMEAEYHPEITLPDRWPIAWGYAPWVEAVWANYLSNAMKYGGRPPCIELGAEALDGTPERPLPPRVVRFWVRDNGTGLTPEEQARLFTPFTRIQVSRAAGHGLGLSIVQRIVEKLGGCVGVDSVAGAGSTFYFTLPAAQ